MRKTGQTKKLVPTLQILPHLPVASLGSFTAVKESGALKAQVVCEITKRLLLKLSVSWRVREIEGCAWVSGAEGSEDVGRRALVTPLSWACTFTG